MPQELSSTQHSGQILTTSGWEQQPRSSHNFYNIALNKKASYEKIEMIMFFRTYQTTLLQIFNEFKLNCGDFFRSVGDADVSLL